MLLIQLFRLQREAGGHFRDFCFLPLYECGEPLFTAVGIKERVCSAAEIIGCKQNVLARLEACLFYGILPDLFRIFREYSGVNFSGFGETPPEQIEEMVHLSSSGFCAAVRL